MPTDLSSSDHSSLLQRKDTIIPPQLITPLNNIALAFSGGGFRAASFALGVLSYLNELPSVDGDDKEKTLLEKVTYLSSASGGTIATATYALHSVSEDRGNFQVYYTNLYKALSGTDILKEALEILTNADDWKLRKFKSRNIINSFALAYEKKLFDGEEMNSLCPGNGGEKSHLSEVCFNATEFFRGLLFKQQMLLKNTSFRDRIHFGNSIIHVNANAWPKIKLSDVMAASSCFPVGFEPIIYPGDFIHAGLSEDELRNSLKIKRQTGDKEEKKYLKNPVFGLMDGGITDNQGLESMMAAQERRIKINDRKLQNKKANPGEKDDFSPFDFMLVNDVGSHFMSPLKIPEVKKTFFGRLNINWLLGLLLILILFSIGLGCYSIKNSNSGLLILATTVFISSSCFYLLILFLGLKLKGTTSKDSAFNLDKIFGSAILGLLLVFLKRTTINVLLQLLRARATSVVSMNSDVFLKRIRFLLYDSFYNSPLWKHRGKGNHVYDLSFTNDINRNSRQNVSVEPSRDMQVVAETAYEMGTTLWFDKTCVEKNHSLECLIATGQFTTCYNLLEYIERLKVSDLWTTFSKTYITRLEEIEVRLRVDFERFKKDPFYMVNECGKGVEKYNAVDISMIPFPEKYKGIK
jgi:hypothetical protein